MLPQSAASELQTGGFPATHLPAPSHFSTPLQKYSSGQGVSMCSFTICKPQLKSHQLEVRFNIWSGCRCPSPGIQRTLAASDSGGALTETW